MRSLPPRDKIARCDGEPIVKSPYIPVMRAQVDGVVKGILLSDVVAGLWVHNVDYRDTPCSGDECEFIHRGRHRSRRRKYFAACAHPTYKKRFVMELTSEAWRLYEKDRNNLVQPARGIVIATWRIGTEKTSPARVHLDYPATEVGELPEAFDPVDAMYELWQRDTVAAPIWKDEPIPE